MVSASDHEIFYMLIIIDYCQSVYLIPKILVWKKEDFDLWKKTEYVMVKGG